MTFSLDVRAGRPRQLRVGDLAGTWECPHTGRVVVEWSCIARPSSVSSAEHLLAALDRRPNRIDTIEGDFSFVIYDPRDDTLTAGRDGVGARPLVYRAVPGRISIATSVADLHRLEDVRLDPTEAWIASFLAGVSMSHTDTPYADVHKLAPGHLLRASVTSGEARLERFHEWRNDPPDATRRDERWPRALRERLDDAVRLRLPASGPIGVESSGGLDSSTCIALAAELGGAERVHAFGWINLDEEPTLIEAVHRRAGLDPDHEHLYRRGDPRRRADPDQVIETLGYPAEHGMGPAHHEFYLRCAELGISTLLSGFGGDEVVTNPAGLLYHELIDRRRFGRLFGTMHGPSSQRPLRFVNELRKARGPSMTSRRLGQGAERLLGVVPLRPQVMQDLAIQARVRHRARYDREHRTINGWILDERLGNEFVVSRLESCALMAAESGVDYRWPLLDRRVVQQYLSSPSIEKRGPGFGRYLHRRAVADVVAPEVAWRETKATGDPLPGPSTRLGPRLSDAPTDAADLHRRLRSVVDPDRLRALAGDRKRAERPVQRALDALDSLHHWLTFCH